MRDPSFVFLANAWWLLPATILIAGITYLMYAKKNPWATYVSRLLGALRIIATANNFFNFIKSFDQPPDPGHRKTHHRLSCGSFTIYDAA